MRTFQTMTKTNPVAALAVLAAAELIFIAQGLRAQTKPDVMALTPEEMKWTSQGGLALPGMEQVVLVGDPVP